MEYQELEHLVQTYRPNADILDHLGHLHLLMVVGPSGVGKSTVVKASGLPEVIGDASRPARPGEQNGVDYWFRSESEMIAEARAGRYLQVAVGAEGDIKATHASSFPSDGIAVFAVVASAVPTFRALPFAATSTAVIVPPDFDSWMQRLQRHHHTASSLALRLREARQSYDFALSDTGATFVLNDTVAAAVERLHEVSQGKQPNQHDRARTIVEHLLQQLPQ